MHYHLAQLNIAQALDEMDAPRMQDFVSQLDAINAMADQAKGFVWRLQSEAGDATALRVFDNPLLLVNMSVWESVEDLKQFVYQSQHVELIRDRASWFDKMDRGHQVLWWVKAGHIPSIEQAKQKLEYLEKHGPSAQAFVFGRTFPAPV